MALVPGSHLGGWMLLEERRVVHRGWPRGPPPLAAGLAVLRSHVPPFVLQHTFFLCQTHKHVLSIVGASIVRR